MAKRYVITGGGGFVGKALGKALCAKGHEVVAIARGEYPELQDFGISSAVVDITSPVERWRDIFKGFDGVFHTAAKVDMWGRREDFFKTNVVGTQNVIAACRYAGVKNMVFTSSPSVIHDGNDLVGVDETYPYPRHFDAYYPETKALAENEVLAVNGTGIKTVALRPHLIWGPGDTNLIPTIVERAKAGTLKRIGDGSNKVDLTFIDDCVEAHVLAMSALERGDQAVYGKVYFISQGDPVNMWDWINDVLVMSGLPQVRRSVPKGIAMAAARVCERVARVLNAIGYQYTPLLTRFLVSEMSTHHFFSIEAAKRDLAYIPSYTIKEAMKKTFQ